MKVAIIGAGPAGMTAAYQLTKSVGVDVDVFEASGNIGGMARTIDLWGQRVDLGPHRFFSDNRLVNGLWLEIVGENYSMIDRLTRIFYNGKYFHYPLRPLDALFNLGVSESIQCASSYLKTLFSKTSASPEHFEAWVRGRFGQRLYEIFFKTYSEKLWGIKCTEIDSRFADQRIKSLSLGGAVWNAVTRGLGNRHRTLIDQFAFPHGGTGRVYESMASKIEENGGRIHLETPVRGILVNEHKACGLYFDKGDTLEYDHIISTMPLTLLVKGLEACPGPVIQAANSLTFRNTILVYMEINSVDVFPDNWIYVHSSEVTTGRITNFRNWTPDLYGDSDTSIICMEYWCNDGDEIWNDGDVVTTTRAISEIEELGLCQRSEIKKTKVIKVPKCYPVYKVGYETHVSVISEYLNQIDGLYPIGRYGAFKYNNQDHSILMGIKAANCIVEKSPKSDLWDINMDTEYQEKFKISEAGLAR